MSREMPQLNPESAIAILRHTAFQSVEFPLIEASRQVGWLGVTPRQPFKL